MVAGGAGFIGSHLVDFLLENGYEVTVVDNLITGSLKNLRGCIKHISFKECDIADFETDETYSMIFDLASIANPTDYVSCPQSVLNSASFGVKRLLDISKRCNSKFIYFSSSEVYGHHLDTDTGFSEDTYCNIPLLTSRSPYYIAKLFGEQYVKTFCEGNNLQYLIVRPFNIYGTRMDLKSPYGRVITNFIKAALQNSPILINGDGNQVRAFCHIDDFLDGLFGYLAHENKENLVNIGNNEPISILNLAKLIVKLTKSSSTLTHVPAIDNEPRYRNPGIDRIFNSIGWVPKITLEKGLAELIQTETTQTQQE